MNVAEAEEHEEPEDVGCQEVLETLPGPGVVAGQAEPGMEYSKVLASHLSLFLL